MLNEEEFFDAVENQLDKFAEEQAEKERDNERLQVRETILIENRSSVSKFISYSFSKAFLASSRMIRIDSRP